MPTVVETLEIQFRADASQVDKAAKKSKQALKWLDKNTKVKVNADTKKAEKQLSSVNKKKKQATQGAAVRVTADTKEATTKLGAVQDQVETLEKKVKVKVDTDDAERSVGKLGNSMSGLMGTLKAAGLVAVAKQGFDMTMNLVNVASDAEQGFSKLQGTLGAGALGMITDYAKQMNASYGFNQTAIYDMASQFVTLFKAYNYEEAQATDYAIRLISQAVDYASFFNMTPAEVGAYFMSMLKGSYEVGDTIGMPLTATRLDTFAEQNGIAGADELATRAAAFVEYAEANADMVGLAGDWDRTASQFANVSTVLGEKWQTLKENAGTKLLPAATITASGLSTMLDALIAWTGPDAPKFEDAFGNMSVSDAKVQEIVKSITGPTDEISAALNLAQSTLSGALDAYNSKYTELAELIGLLYGGGESITEAQNDEIGVAINEYDTAAQQVVAQSKASLVSMLLTFAGDESEWTDATQTALDNIDAYFTTISESVTTKMGALRDTIWEAVQGDKIIDAMEMNEILNQSKDVMQELYQNSMVEYGAALQEYIDKNAGVGLMDAASIEKLMTGALETASEKRAAIDEYYAAVRSEVYKAAERNRMAYEESPEEYIARYGAPPATAQEMLVDVEAGHTKQMAQLDADLANKLARYFLPSLLSGYEGMASGEAMYNADIYKQIVEPMAQFGEYVEYIRSAQSKGATLNAESLAFLDLYDSIMAMSVEASAYEMLLRRASSGGIASYAVGEALGTDLFTGFQEILSGAMSTFYGKEYQFSEETGPAEVEAPAVVSAVEESNSLLRIIAAKDYQPKILGGYNTGKVFAEAERKYHYVKGV